VQPAVPHLDIPERESRGVRGTDMRRLRALLATGVLVALVALALSSCGGGASGAGSSGAGGDQKENPLVGTWRRVRTCEEYVHQLKQAGLAEMISGHQVLVEEFGTGNAAQSGQDSNDPC
jgi:hypothetical protein